MNTEEWRPVRGFEGRYEVSNLGRLRSLLFDPRGRVMKVKPDARGYVRAQLQWSTKRLMHRVVAEAFIPNPDNLPAVNHIDGNASNNAVANLEWVTHSENMAHSWRKLESYKNRVAVSPRGEAQWRHILKEVQVLAIRDEYARGGTSQRKLAKKYGVSKPAIQAITSRRTWAHI